VPSIQSSPDKRMVRLSAYVADLAADELRNAAGARIDLRPRSFAVLRLLAENAGHVVTKDRIIETVWRGVVVTEDSLTQCIADIRKAIDDDDRRLLRTVHGKGYVLVPTQRAQLAGRAPDRPSLAVMPFLSLGAEDSFGWGVALEIINELARNKDLRLIGRDSCFALANQHLMAQELGERLGVRYLVEGTAQRADGMLLVDVQLVDTENGSIAWGDRFTAAADNIPAVQREIAGKIAGSVHSGMRETEKHHILGAAPRDLDVYELTLRGIARKHQFNPEATRAGRADLEEAIRRDPNYAPAHAYLAWINLIDMICQFTGEWQPARLGEVIGQFHRAIESDANFPTAYQGLSQGLIHTGDVAQALAAARRAVELGPSDADGLLFLANALLESGELDEAMAVADRAVELNPLRPAYYCFFHAKILWGNECYQEALDEIEECARKAPQFPVDCYRVLSLVGLGRIDEARAELARVMAKPGGMVIVPLNPPELASRAMSALQAAGWRPTLAAERRTG
jgi:TolB-like protein/Tfp pilus assembly protein PilF